MTGLQTHLLSKVVSVVGKTGGLGVVVYSSEAGPTEAGDYAQASGLICGL